MKNFSSKGIRFSGDSIKSCVGFIDLVDSTKTTITMESLDYIRRYYSTFINSVSENVKSYSINQELSKQQLPPYNYRITMDYGVLDLALVGDYSQIDLFGTTVNLCSKINSSPSLSIHNEIIIGDNLYRILKSFPTIINNYNFINNGEYKISESNRYSTYNIKRKNILEQ